MADTQAQAHVHRDSNLSACDGCYARKIKCDRGLPCGNCLDADVDCLRTRQKPERKPKAVPSDSSENIVKHLSAAIEALETRMARIEAAPVTFVPSPATRGHQLNPSPKVDDVSQQQPQGQGAISAGSAAPPPTKKMRLTDQTHDSKTPSSLSVGPELWACSPDDVDNLKTSRSALDAQDIIQHELRLNRGIRKDKTESLRSALETLKEALKYKATNDQGAYRRQKPISDLVTRLPADQWVIPPLEMVQWMLTSVNAVDSLWSLPDGLPVVSRQSLVDMFLTLDGEEQPGHHPAFVVCVNSSVAYFLLERTTAGEAVRELGNSLRNRITSYFAAAQAALNCITPSSPPSLPTLQALVYGLVNSQEVGDASQSWRYTAAACAMCIELGLHQEDESLVSPTCAGSMAEARYCLFVCYVNDKALAMNLGLPPCLPDEHIYVDLRSIVGPTKPALRQLLQNYYLELAIAQGGVVKLQLAKIKQYGPVNGAIAQTLDVLDNAWSLSIVLYYPFTSYFVLFCHVVVTGNINDLRLMEGFVEYLAELKEISIPFEKLHALCLPFHSLAMFASDPVQGHPGVSPTTSGIPGRPSTSQVKVPQNISSLVPSAVNGTTYGEADLTDLDLTVDYEDMLGGLLEEQPSLDWLDCDFSALIKTWEV
ncbi:Arabinanolytic transcriptional activator araR [Paramyrothecium foliicola]|nr:Arabinanolytic transcriptional activator araR [Paramyrothecium foliicola]